ncbi:MAG: hypothetical protein EAY75_11815 [Bacteroidetes bacterium]|nr:MAG: hypothetical protein EAY75_11815 [Bacteroidota bacterium]
MTPLEELLDCLSFFNLPVVKVQGNVVQTTKGYAIEVEANGLYKLLQHNEVIAPFDDVNELSHFILEY